MRTLFFVSFLGLGLVACSSTTTGNGNGDGGTMSSDSGMMMTGGDSGPGNPNGGPITFPAQCPSFTPCGGAVVGTWDYTGGCISNPFDDLKSQCPSLTVMDQKGTVKGTVVFTDTRVKRNGIASYSATIVLPPTCTMGVPCSTFNGNGATCTGSAGTCNCQVSRTDSITNDDTYVASGNKIVTGGGNEYSYCVTGNKIQYSETGAMVEHEGVFELTKR